MQYAATIFLSSFLLFLVQPLIARLILPWFGGSAAVWTTCMLFFQALLLAGYAYAHLLIRSRKMFQALIHTALIAAAIATLPIGPAASWKPLGGEEPIGAILLLLCVSVGLPYFLLASTSPLLQAWFSRARPGANPYPLFAVSNLASLGALVGYPFVVAPVFATHVQVSLWSWGFAAFGLLCALIAWRSPAAARENEEEARSREAAGNTAGGTAGEAAGETARPPYLAWLAFSAVPSALLLAVTNHLTQNVAAVPLLWLAPLTLYLLSFIVTFDGRGWYRPRALWPAVVAGLLAMAWLLVDERLRLHLGAQLAVYLPGLLLACVFCHGELYAMRPAPRRLTAFYLSVAAGGALGGLFVAVLAPLAFNAYYELGVGLVALALLAALRFAGLGRLAGLASLAALFGATAGAVYEAFAYQKDVRLSERSFYGVLRVKEYGHPGEEAYLRRLMHGAIMHGEQYMTGHWRRFITSYYQASSGIGVAIRSSEARPIKVGVIGLGAGTIAAYGRPGDVYRFYEINPQVIRIAQTEFSFLSESRAKVELALGDARLALEREAPQGFDVLAVDAFSGDAIPVHLITREALATYLRHMKPEGIVAFHVSNRFLDLVPVVARIAREEGAHAVLVADDPDEDDTTGRSRSDWVLVSRSAQALARPEMVQAKAAQAPDRADWRTWTDDYSNLIQILK